MTTMGRDVKQICCAGLDESQEEVRALLPSSQKSRGDLLRHVVRIGYVHVLASILQACHIDFNEEGHDGSRLCQDLLRIACTHRRWEVAELLLEAGRVPADTLLNGSRWTILHYCILQGRLETMDMVLTKHPDVDYSELMQFTWAHWNSPSEHDGAGVLDTMLNLVRHHTRHGRSPCQGMDDYSTRYPIQAILLSPLPCCQVISNCIRVYPKTALSLIDQNGQLPLHIALTRPTTEGSTVISASLIKWMWRTEPRSALIKDPVSGFYPFEAAASFSSGEQTKSDERMHSLRRTLCHVFPEGKPNDDRDDDRDDETDDSLEVDFATLHLDLIYSLLRCNPNHLVHRHIA